MPRFRHSHEILVAMGSVATAALIACSGDTTGPTTDRDVSVAPPDLVYVGWSGTSDYDIYGINADGTGIRPLATGPTRDFDPAWSRDGLRLAFVSRQGAEHSLSVINADGSGRTRIGTDEMAFGEIRTPSWSPDGDRLVFAASAVGAHPSESSIYTIKVNGTGLRRLTNAPYGDGHPAWSPDGTQIAYISQREMAALGAGGRQGMLYVMNADGSGSRRLLEGIPVQMLSASSGGAARPPGSPDWSPDGEEIAMYAGGGYAELTAIVVLNVATGALRRVTPESSTSIVAGPPSWSVDGTRIAFVAMTDQGDLYTIGADGSDLVRLVATGLRFRPRFRPVPVAGS